MISTSGFVFGALGVFTIFIVGLWVHGRLRDWLDEWALARVKMKIARLELENMRRLAEKVSKRVAEIDGGDV